MKFRISAAALPILLLMLLSFVTAAIESEERLGTIALPSGSNHALIAGGALTVGVLTAFGVAALAREAQPVISALQRLQQLNEQISDEDIRKVQGEFKKKVTLLQCLIERLLIHMKSWRDDLPQRTMLLGCTETLMT